MTVRIFVILATLTVYMTPETTLAAHPGRGRLSAIARGPRPHLRADELYSTHARRRFAAFLRLRLLEMREAGLERAAAVVERRLPVGTLVPPVRER